MINWIFNKQKIREVKKLLVVVVLGTIGFCAEAQVKVESNGNVKVGSGFNSNNHLGNELEVRGDVSVSPTTFSSMGAIPALILGSYIANFGGLSFTYPAIYGKSPQFFALGPPYFNGSFYLGTPCNWAVSTYSENIHYVKSLQTEVKIVTATVSTSLSPQLKDVHTYKAEVSISPDSEEQQYVFFADELQAVFPELVCTNELCEGETESRRSINYVGMVPILTGAINEQQVLIETQQQEIAILQDIAFGQELDLTELYELRNEVAELRYVVNVLLDNCCKDITIPPYYRDTTNNNSIQQLPTLYQNTPNPFTSNTEISCDIPAMNTSAFIYIYNLQGVELMSFPIIQIGYSTVYVYASTLPAGMYLYTLVVDNVIIDTKRMILTK